MTIKEFTRVWSLTLMLVHTVYVFPLVPLVFIKVGDIFGLFNCPSKNVCSDGALECDKFCDIVRHCFLHYLCWLSFELLSGFGLGGALLMENVRGSYFCTLTKCPAVLINLLKFLKVFETCIYHPLLMTAVVLDSLTVCLGLILILVNRGHRYGPANTSDDTQSVETLSMSYINTETQSINNTGYINEEDRQIVPYTTVHEAPHSPNTTFIVDPTSDPRAPREWPMATAADEFFKFSNGTGHLPRDLD